MSLVRPPALQVKRICALYDIFMTLLTEQTTIAMKYLPTWEKLNNWNLMQSAAFIPPVTISKHCNKCISGTYCWWVDLGTGFWRSRGARIKRTARLWQYCTRDVRTMEAMVRLNGFLVKHAGAEGWLRAGGKGAKSHWQILCFECPRTVVEMMRMRNPFFSRISTFNFNSVLHMFSSKFY